MNTTRCLRGVTSGLLVACAALSTSGHVPTAGAALLSPVTMADGGLGISAPSVPVSLGSGSPGSTFSTQLGTVTVTAPPGTSSWTAAATLTSSFRVTQGGQTWVLPNDRVSYAAGPAVSSTINLNLCTPGQVAPESLVQSRRAFRCLGVVSLSPWSVRWNPTLTIQSEPTDPAGTYTGTITHSVA